MTKSNKILICIFTLVVSLMIGYALFSETITVTGTATSKGDFSVSRTCTPGIDPKILSYLDFEVAKEGGYRNDSCSVVGNKFSTNVSLDYPTAGRWFTFTITNTGTIKQMLYLDDVYENFTVCRKEDGVETCIDVRENANQSQFEFIKNYYYYAILLAKDKQGNYYFYSADEDFSMYDEEKNAYVVDTGETIVIALYQYWQQDNPPYSQGNNYGDFVTTINAEFNLVQETN